MNRDREKRGLEGRWSGNMDCSHSGLQGHKNNPPSMTMAGGMKIVWKAMCGYVDSVVSREPVHHVVRRPDERSLRDFLFNRGFVELSALRFQQVFKPGCRWGVALDVNHIHQLHVRCFPLGPGHLFLNAHWEYHRRYPSLHFGYPHDWNQGSLIFNRLMAEFFQGRKQMQRQGGIHEEPVLPAGVSPAWERLTSPSVQGMNGDVIR